MDIDSLNGSNFQGPEAPISRPYTELDQANGQFRVLLLEPGRHDDEIRIQLAPVWLVLPPWYEALSYVWGTELAPYPLVADAQYKMAITKNLDYALRCLRQPKGIRTLWVDALCIDQQNIQEKNDQVRKMAQIYLRAHRTLIWLGLDEGHNYHTLFLHMDKQIRPNSDSTLTQLIEELHHLTNSPWFSRLWVLQELVMSMNDPMVYIGRFRIPWSDFESGAIYLSGVYLEHTRMRLSEEDMNLSRATLNESAKIKGFGRLRECGRESSLEVRLFDSMLQTATDPRDHVYGILGISDVGQNILAPDYDLSVQAVFTKTVSVLLEYYSPVLYCVYPLRYRLNGVSTDIAQNSDLPSWVPDLAGRATWKVYETREDKRWSPVMLLRTPDIAPILRSFIERPKRPCIAKFSEDYKTMFAIGSALGTITWASVSDPFTDPGAECRLHNLYHTFAKKHGFTPGAFQQALHDLKPEVLDPLHLEYFLNFLECDSVPEDIDPRHERFMRDVLRSASCRNIFVTDTGKFGQSYYPEQDAIRAGDVLVGLFGNNFPFILRPTSAEKYKMINVAYVIDHEWGELHPVIESSLTESSDSWSGLENCDHRVYEIL